MKICSELRRNPRNGATGRFENLSREVSKSNIPQELSVEKDKNKEMLFMMYCYMYGGNQH